MSYPSFVLWSCLITAGTAAVTYALSSRRLLAVGVALVGAYGLLVLHGVAFFRSYPVDDAFITFRYSQHLADGLGPNWNSTGRVDGYTSFLWMALIAAVSKLGLDIIDAARVILWLSLLGVFAATLRVWSLWAREQPGSGIDHPLVPAIALLGLGLADGVAFWGFSGMETPLFMALLALGALCYFRERRGGRVPWSAAVFAALTMTRPEGAIAAGITGAAVFVEALFAADRRQALLRAAAWPAVFFAIAGAYYVWRLAYYDSYLPNTFYAKVEPTSAVYERGADYALDGLMRYHLVAMAVGMAGLITLPRLRGDALYIALLSAAMLGVTALEGGDAFGHGRFIAPLLPLLFLAGAAGFASMLRRATTQRLQLAAGATALAAIAALALLRGSDNPYLNEGRRAGEDRHLLGVWLREHTPPDYTIGLFAAGSVGYYSDRDVVDMLGLNDRVIAHTDVPSFGTSIAGHEKYNADYIFETVRPEIIITGDSDPRALTEAELRAIMTAGSLPAKQAYMNDPRLWERYDVRSIEIEGRWFNVLQRADTLAPAPTPAAQ